MLTIKQANNGADENRHYTAITSLSRLLASKNSKHEHQEYFCMNCLQRFHSIKSRDNHYEYCKENEAVKIIMPSEKDSWLEHYGGQS